jgi:MFS transporter, FHS family, L-fucose permease
MNKRTNYLLPFILVTCLFFFWGLIHNMDPVLIAKLRKAYKLTTLESSLVDFSVFIAYFLMALPAGIIMRKYGYRSGIILGLLLFAAGSFLFIPAADHRLYGLFLGALFIIACGLTVLETAANPYVTVLGAPETATFRLNLAQSFNGLAAMLGPLIAGKFMLSDHILDDAQFNGLSVTAQAAYLEAEASSVKVPYIIIGFLILLMAVLFYRTRLPDIKEEETAGANPSVLSAFRHRHLTNAVIAQFFYVGAQVCVGSFFIVLANKAAGISDKSASQYMFAYGLAFMTGRFLGTMLMRSFRPERLLTVFAVLALLCTLATIYSSGMVVVYALIGIAFFMSIMFPTIFALGIKNLGADTKIGSSLIIMSIVGGALLPLALGYISDRTGSIQNGYWVAAVCFAVVAWFGISGYRQKKLMVVQRAAVKPEPV